MSEYDKITAHHAEDLRRAWAALLATREGRMVVWSILQGAHLFDSTFTGNSAGTHMEGRRSIALDLLNAFILPNGANLLGQMMAEAKDRENEARRAANRDQSSEEEHG